MSDHDDAGPPEPPDTFDIDREIQREIERGLANLEPPPPFRPDDSLITYIEGGQKRSQRKRRKNAEPAARDDNDLTRR